MNSVFVWHSTLVRDVNVRCNANIDIDLSWT